ncbi:MAG TPA: hypothetical protein ENK59_02220 [Thioploca sp.]|nr:hypothetical protein [Thioploca sp.]
MLDSEIEKRLNELESEQEQQINILEEFSNFEDEIRKLESTLNQIDKFYLQNNKETDFSNLRDLKKTEELEKELESMSTFSATPNIKAQENTKNSSATNSTNYVICLVTNPKLPREWSGKEWCARGKGMRYKTVEQVKQTFKMLKKQFPNQSIKIFKK